ncbi:DUF6020 family protein [Rufibacter roseolus]|uniref:DUF6020 family protein n=1 Tax=Rufibacter roseolus TaxID=2817375 RepID=UPI001B30CA33|nr:DUF6020 family protein [Rufibacter roseolus]
MMDRPLRSFLASGTLLRHFVVYALPCLLCWSVYFLAYHPGMMSQDSLDQWRQVSTFDFDDWHPAFLSYLYWLLSRLWLSPGVVCVTQILALAWVFAYGMVQLEKFGLPWWGLGLLTLFFCLFPLNGFYVNTLFKDVPFSIAFLLAFIYLLQIVESKGLWLNYKRNILAFALTLGFICVIRHNGIMTVVTIAGTLLAGYWALKRRTALLIVLVVSTVFLVKGPLYKAIQVQGRFFGVEMLMTHQIAAAINAGAALTQNEQRFLHTVLPQSTWQQHYNPFEVDSLVFNGHFNYPFLMQEWARREYRAVWFGIIRRNVPALLRHQAQVTDLVWNIGLQPGSYNYAVHPVIDTNEMGLQLQPVLPGLQSFLTREIHNANRNYYYRTLLLRPATYLYLNILLLLLISRYLRWKEVLLLALPILSLAFGVFLTIPAQHVRYLYPCFLLAPFLAGYWISLLARTSDLQKALQLKQKEVKRSEVFTG